MERRTRLIIEEAAEKAGVLIESVEQGRKHIKVHVRSKDGLHSGFVISGTSTSCRRAAMNLTSNMRRIGRGEQT